MMDELLKGLARALAENARDNQSGTDSVLIAEQDRVLREVGLGELLEAAGAWYDARIMDAHASARLAKAVELLRAALAGAEKGGQE